MLETVSNIHGRTLNPANTLLSAGGSSGGEGALIACRGSLLGLGTDVGGSIRCPCDFNGLYGLKPSTGRISFLGCEGYASGSLAIPGVVGPMGLSMDDVNLFCEVASADEPWSKDMNVVEKPWVKVEPPKKLSIGVMWWDEVVMPHPPINRALKTAVEKLRADGHEGTWSKFQGLVLQLTSEIYLVIDFQPHEHLRGFNIVVSLASCVLLYSSLGVYASYLTLSCLSFRCGSQQTRAKSAQRSLKVESQCVQRLPNS